MYSQKNSVMSDLEIIQQRLERLSQRIDMMEKVIGKNLSQEKARKILGVSRNTIISYRKKGLLPYSVIGGKISIALSDIERLMQLR